MVCSAKDRQINQHLCLENISNVLQNGFATLKNNLARLFVLFEEVLKGNVPQVECDCWLWQVFDFIIIVVIIC